MTGWVRAARLWGVILAVVLAVEKATAQPAPERVVLQLKWLHQFQFAGYYAALEQGYYREAGLEVELREAVAGRDPVAEVLEGNAQYGVGTSELLILRARGAPVVVLGVVFQHSPLVLLARQREDLSSLHDLRGQPIMIEPQSAELFAYLRNEGLSERDLQVVHHTFEVEDLLAGRVAAMSAYVTDELFLLRSSGVPHLVFTPRAGGIDFYGDNFFTTEAELAAHPDRVRRFREATIRGWRYAMDYPEEMVNLILERFGRRKSREHLLFEAWQTRLLMIPELLDPGHMIEGRWRHIAETYADFGMVPRDFDLDGFLYREEPESLDLRWVYGILGGLVLLTLGMLGWAVPLARLNRRLQAEVRERKAAEESARRAQAEAERSSQAKSRFIGFLTHEVRSPLAGIAGLIELMLEEVKESQVRDHLSVMARSVAGLLDLIHVTLEQERLAAGGIRLRWEPVRTTSLADGVIESFQALARRRGVVLKSNTSSGVPASLLTDAMRVRQILSNLVGNALKFTPEGDCVTVELSANADGAVCWTVRDTGPGIAANRLEAIFDPYVQENATVASRHGGTGLGLPISRQLATLLGGSLTVVSTPGSGAAFTLRLPDHRGTPDGGEGGGVQF